MSDMTTTSTRKRVRHGLRAAKLPEDARYVQNATDQLRRSCEAALCRTPSVYEAALIQSACRHERRASLCERWLRLAEDAGELDLSTKLQLQRDIGNATDSRDKCLERLGVNTSPTSPWDTVYLPSPETPQERTGAADDKSCDRDGERTTGANGANGATCRTAREVDTVLEQERTK